ncbi:16S rRNA pseudouridine(516) synthase [Shewanella sp. Scap07]|uniref:pseudouridine synthase n=1 Tax=Shewanella sp. Scap07 TaxID=2589987 RepID=UPI0015BB7B1D|nr:16S rRNA pseudouridine(516) synthase [Shewanella sp. Scap07]QLE84436.1 16S rRNA pseudouridine(516) synthase [Shewanella sp. Scap07]
MRSNRSRLDRFISQHQQLPRKQIRLLVAQGAVTVDGVVARDVAMQINQFSYICLHGEVLQAQQPVYLMQHKPVGVVSATVDDKHQTVLDLIDHQDKQQLHIVGRLDLNTSGLMLLTNDGQWSKRLMSPEHKVAKRYRVTLQNPLNNDYVEAFAQGMYFEYEDIVTQPAQLEIIDTTSAIVTLTEGRYHQIKRMFGRFRNPVIGLHRFAVGNLVLDDSLQVGQSRMLSADEVSQI